jgi:hypothetical protein
MLRGVEAFALGHTAWRSWGFSLAVFVLEPWFESLGIQSVPPQAFTQVGNKCEAQNEMSWVGGSSDTDGGVF